MDMPAMPPVTLFESCVQQAAAHYNAHPNLIRAVAQTENCKTGKILWNKDGSFDMGRMCINSVHLPELSRYGITQERLVHDECLNVHIGTYYLQKGIVTSSDFWKGVGNYHSKTPSKNIRYQYKVWENLQKVQGAKR